MLSSNGSSNFDKMWTLLKNQFAKPQEILHTGHGPFLKHRKLYPNHHNRFSVFTNCLMEMASTDFYNIGISYHCIPFYTIRPFNWCLNNVYFGERWQLILCVCVLSDCILLIFHQIYV